jgi:O-antigen/teichoic acid export membrane protein
MRTMIPIAPVTPEQTRPSILRAALRWIRTNSIILFNAGSMVGATAITSLLGFVYWWLAARSFQPEAVGLASAAISAMTLLGSVAIVGLGTLLLGELPLQRGRAASLVSAALLTVGAIGGLLGLAFAVIAPRLSTGFRPIGADIGSIVLFALGVSFTAITLVLDDALIGLFRGGLQLWRNALFAVTKLGMLLAVSLWIARVTGLTIYATWAIGNACSLAALAGYVLVKRGWRVRDYLPQWNVLRKLGSSALKHHLLNVTLQAPALILPVLVTMLLSATVNAWFYVSWNLTSIVNIFSAALTMTLFAAAAAQPGTLAHKMRLTLSLAFAASAVVNIALLFGTKQILGFFGHSYADQAAWSLRFLSLESFPFIIKNHYIALSRIEGRMVDAARLTILTGVLELGGATLGMLAGGLTGLSVGWFCVMSIEALCMSHAVFKATRLPKRSPEISPVEEVVHDYE